MLGITERMEGGNLRPLLVRVAGVVRIEQMFRLDTYCIMVHDECLNAIESVLVSLDFLRSN